MTQVGLSFWISCFQPGLQSESLCLIQMLIATGVIADLCSTIFKVLRRYMVFKDGAYPNWNGGFLRLGHPQTAKGFPVTDDPATWRITWGRPSLAPKRFISIPVVNIVNQHQFRGSWNCGPMSGMISDPCHERSLFVQKRVCMDGSFHLEDHSTS